MSERPSYGATHSGSHQREREASKPAAAPTTKVEPKVFLASERCAIVMHKEGVPSVLHDRESKCGSSRSPQQNLLQLAQSLAPSRQLRTRSLQWRRQDREVDGRPVCAHQPRRRESMCLSVTLPVKFVSLTCHVCNRSDTRGPCFNVDRIGYGRPTLATLVRKNLSLHLLFSPKYHR